MYGVENFSLWCDFVERDFLKGEFVELLDKEVFNGATSNPAIFKSSFLTSSAYQETRKRLKNLDAKEIYEKLAVEDIKIAATSLKSLYDNQNDGFISIEVDPTFCDDAKATIKEGRELYKKIGYKNVMIKIPATSAGYEAMEELMSDGINVNATLIFSPNQAKECIEAFKRANDRLGVRKKLPSGVISVFVSRFDSKLDKRLKDLEMPVFRVGIYNATKIYDIIESYGLNNVRTLFASTGVKSDLLEADYYIKELLYKNCVNTAPLGTIKAFMNSCKPVEVNPTKEYVDFFDKLKHNNIDMQEVYEELLKDGLKAFKNAFKEILEEF